MVGFGQEIEYRVGYSTLARSCNTPVAKSIVAQIHQELARPRSGRRG